MQKAQTRWDPLVTEATFLACNYAKLNSRLGFMGAASGCVPTAAGTALTRADMVSFDLSKIISTNTN